MSTTLSMQGIRGGVGTSTVLAALGHALNRLEQRVLLIDMCPENLLGLHFNLPADEELGWARAEIEGKDWRDCAYTPFKDLALLPYGRILPEQTWEIERRLAPWPGISREQLIEYASEFDWLLFDLPQGLPMHVAAVEGDGGCDLMLRVVNVDPGCHVRLQRAGWDGAFPRVLVNRYDASIQLQRNLMQLWLQDHEQRLLPMAVHEDAAVPEALAMKMPVGMHAADSLAGADLEGLALWCQAEIGRLERAGELS